MVSWKARGTKRLTDLLGAMHHALVGYAEVLARTSGEAAPHDSAKLIAPMLSSHLHR